MIELFDQFKNLNYGDIFKFIFYSILIVLYFISQKFGGNDSLH